MLATLETFFRLGNADFTESEWFAVSEHGSPQQRAMAASTGLLSSHGASFSSLGAPVGPTSMLSGLPFCYGYRDYVPSDTADIGPYRLLKPPGLSTSFSEAGVFVVEPEGRTGQEGSIVLMSWIENLPHGATTAQLEQTLLVVYPGARAIGDPIPLDAHVSPGVAQYFELVPTSEQQVPQSGLFSLLAPSSGRGGLLIPVVRTQLAPTEPDAPGLAILEEQIVRLFQIINRLCTPDQSGDPSAPNFEPACMDGQ